MDKAPCTKFCVVLISPHEVTRLQSFEFGMSDVIPTNYKIFHPWFSLHIFVNFMEKEAFAVLCSFWPFLMNLWSYEVWMIKLSRHKWRHTCKYANYGLHVNFWKFWLMPFYFMMKNIILSKSNFFDLRSSLKFFYFFDEFTVNLMFSGGRRVHWKRMKNRNQSINFRSNINALTQLCCAYCQGLRKWRRSGKLFNDETLFDVVFSKNCTMTFLYIYVLNYHKK